MLSCRNEAGSHALLILNGLTRLFMRCGIIIERDGILNRMLSLPPTVLGPATLEELDINMEAQPPLLRLKEAGFILVATTNQPGLSAGTQCRRELDRIHEAIRQAFSLDDILVCPHGPEDECNCRKPRPGLITEAVFKWHMDLDRSYVVSDKWQDAAAAHSAGCKSLLIHSPWIGSGHHDIVLPSLEAITEKILTLESGNGNLKDPRKSTPLHQAVQSSLAKAATL
jgi:histidinol-phosphate phosphatase family protein